MNAPWECLFPPLPNKSAGKSVAMRLARKRGEALLLLPTTPKLASAAMTLYPAQTRLARLARSGLSLALRSGLGLGTEPVAIELDSASEFVRFLFPDAAQSFDFAMLLGNPRAPGRRFVILAFDERGNPGRVVKAGCSNEARRLIEREAAFLKTVEANRVGAPALLGEFSGGGVQAMALEFVGGRSPERHETGAIAELLTSWLDSDRTMAFGELPIARRLVETLATESKWNGLVERLKPAQIRPAIYHGDFTAWNVRVNTADAKWRVLDWERGEIVGPPGWDWFHFFVQQWILVERRPVERILRDIRSLMRSEEFTRYAARAGLGGIQEDWLLAYLLYASRVLKPAEGGAELEKLIEQLALNIRTVQ